ncbi:MAG: TIGR00730 family Rossman fold protein [Selenomonadaceae bacterium]|nr:TIGR00730 family Rossman fold protein [Selenomonadaceae bacterium]
MNITVYLGSFNGKFKVYKDAVRKLGYFIGENNHTLIYGGSTVGLMGTLADSALEKGGKVIGVEPRFFVEAEVQHEGITELIVTETMAERKGILIEMGDVFVAFPGGLGTLEEITELMTLNKVGVIKKPFYFLNINDYYEPLKKFFKQMVDEGFLEREFYDSIKFLPSVEELEKQIRKIHNK